MITVLGIAVNVCGLIMVVLNMIFLFGLARELYKNNLEWSYLITRDGKRVSATKILQLVGGFTGTWIVIRLTLGGTITWDMFMIYLTYVASVEGFSKFVSHMKRDQD
jgi:hypothetical protein